MNHTKSARIAIIYHQSCIDSIPCLTTWMSLLTKYNVTLDVYCINNNLNKIPQINDSKINLYILNSHYIGGESFFKSKTIYRILYMIKFFIFILKECRFKNYDFYTGVDFDALIVSYLISKIFNKKLIYFSLELLIPSEIDYKPYSLLARGFKFFETIASKTASATIIQDDIRAKLLAKENQVDIRKIYVIPNAPIGKAKLEKKYSLYEMFKIDKNKTLLLYAGTLAEWAYIAEISDEATKLTDKYVTIFQSRSYLNDSTYIDGIIKNVDCNKVVFSLEPFPYSEIDKLYSSADIGLAFYNIQILGTNCQEMGLASGKIAHYLFRGIPVIVNRETSLANLVEEYQCGIVIDNFQKINQACDRIMDNYQQYSDNACFCFNQLLEVEEKFIKFYQEVINLT